LLAVVGSVVINLVLFMLLPFLIQAQNSALNKFDSTAVTMVRVAPPPPPPPPQHQVPPQQPPQPVVKHQQIASLRPKIAQPQLKLNLELRPELSNLAGDVVLPDVQLAQLEPVPAIFDSAALDRPLTPLAQSPFIYPMRAKRLGLEGWVRIKLLISKQGTVEQVQILAAEPPDVFEQTVERGVRLWRFSPGTVDGEAVRSWVVTTVRFELES
jgi:protein TonB